MENSTVNLAEYVVGKINDLLKGFPGIQGTIPAKKHSPDQSKIDRWDFGFKCFKGDIKGIAELNKEVLTYTLGLKTRMGNKKSTKVFPLKEYIIVENASPHFANIEEIKKQLGIMLKEIEV